MKKIKKIFIKKNFNKRKKSKFEKFFLKVPHQQFLGSYFFRKYKRVIRKDTKKNFKYFFSSKMRSSLSRKKMQRKRIHIRITQNNIFCTFIQNKKNKILHVGSSGKYNIKISKKKLKHFFKFLIIKFFISIKKLKKNYNNTLFTLIAPRKIRRDVYKIIKRRLVLKKKRFLSKKVFRSPNFKKKTFQQRRNMTIFIKPKKCFNGCKAGKKIRKKRKFNRIFK